MSNDVQEVSIASTVKATMQQAYDLNLTVNILPSREIPTIRAAGCQPRQGAQRMDKDPLPLPEPTRAWLLDVGRLLVPWLAKDASNQQLFLTDPIQALHRAGVAPERTHIKALSRLREELGMAAAVVPGLQLQSIQTRVRTSGTVRQPESTVSEWRPPQIETNREDCGCQGTKGKE